MAKLPRSLTEIDAKRYYTDCQDMTKLAAKTLNVYLRRAHGQTSGSDASAVVTYLGQENPIQSGIYLANPETWVSSESNRVRETILTFKVEARGRTYFKSCSYTYVHRRVSEGSSFDVQSIIIDDEIYIALLAAGTRVEKELRDKYADDVRVYYLGQARSTASEYPREHMN